MEETEVIVMAKAMCEAKQGAIPCDKCMKNARQAWSGLRDWRNHNARVKKREANVFGSVVWGIVVAGAALWLLYAMYGSYLQAMVR